MQLTSELAHAQKRKPERHVHGDKTLPKIETKTRGHMSKVFILGVDHFLQNIESACTTPVGKESETNQKNELRARIEGLISNHRPDLIAEEAKLDRECMGKQIADAHGCKYCNLTMPLKERSKSGVSRDYDRAKETRRAAYRVFEAFMFEQIQKNRGSSDNILVICGSYHADGLERLFRTAGDDVETEDTYHATWYRGRPEESSGEVIGFYKETHGRSDTGK